MIVHSVSKHVLDNKIDDYNNVNDNCYCFIYKLLLLLLLYRCCMNGFKGFDCVTADQPFN